MKRCRTKASSLPSIAVVKGDAKVYDIRAHETSETSIIRARPISYCTRNAAETPPAHQMTFLCEKHDDSQRTCRNAASGRSECQSAIDTMCHLRSTPRNERAFVFPPRLPCMTGARTSRPPSAKGRGDELKPDLHAHIVGPRDRFTCSVSFRRSRIGTSRAGNTVYPFISESHSGDELELPVVDEHFSLDMRLPQQDNAPP